MAKKKTSKKKHSISIDKINIDALPDNPAKVYKNKGWKGWDDFYGIKSKKKKL